MKIFTSVCCILFCLSAFAQKPQYSKVSESDPKAKKILDALKKDYNSYKSMEVNFELTLELPERPKEVQKGKFIQSGKKFTATTKDQEVYCDGKSIWLYIKANKEVQLNNYDPSMSSDDMMMSPAEMIKLYENGKYIYAITGSETIAGAAATLIEFKPVDKNSPYTKMRMAVDAKTNKAIYLKVFSKDGSRYTLNLKSIVPNKSYSNDTFIFNAKKYPGVKVEDLRID